MENQVLAYGEKFQQSYFYRESKQDREEMILKKIYLTILHFYSSFNIIFKGTDSTFVPITKGFEAPQPL